MTEEARAIRLLAWCIFWGFILHGCMTSTARAEELRTPLDLSCTVWSITPSEIDNPKAVDWWTTQSKLDNVALTITQEGVHLSGALIERIWESVNGEITDWSIKLTFGNYGERYHMIRLSTLTASGFFYVNYDENAEENEPKYKVSCEQA